MFVMPMLAEKIIHAATMQPSPWLPALITFFFGQGSRAGETFAIDARDDIDLSGRWAMLRDPKNGHERRVTLQRALLRLFHSCPTSASPALCSAGSMGRPLRRKLAVAVKSGLHSRAPSRKPVGTQRR